MFFPCFSFVNAWNLSERFFLRDFFPFLSPWIYVKRVIFSFIFSLYLFLWMHAIYLNASLCLIIFSFLSFWIYAIWQNKHQISAWFLPSNTSKHCFITGLVFPIILRTGTVVVLCVEWYSCFAIMLFFSGNSPSVWTILFRTVKRNLFCLLDFYYVLPCHINFSIWKIECKCL